MHFLCLHGTGTNSQVFETQTAAIRYEMDAHHTFEFVEGTMACEVAPEIKAYYPATDTYYQYYDQSSAASMNLALAQLSAYIEAEGPFDGVIGYSQGASLAATYLIKYSRQNPSAPLPFKCAVFFSGGKPLDPLLLEEGELKLIDPVATGALLSLPTANIWGRNDMLWPGSSQVLSDLCEIGTRSVVLHDEGHDVPGGRAKEAVQGSVRAIRRTVDKALTAQ